jgi:hypothetical protein
VFLYVCNNLYFNLSVCIYACIFNQKADKPGIIQYSEHSLACVSRFKAENTSIIGSQSEIIFLSY